MICDQMLLKLSRWLRIAGYDVITPNIDDDADLVRLSISSKRPILTRDKQVHERKAVESFLIISDDIDEQLIEFSLSPYIDVPRGRTRCPVCNGRMRPIIRSALSEDMKKHVPLKVVMSSDRFFHCPNCGKVYWIGSHWEPIITRLDKAGLGPTLP